MEPKFSGPAYTVGIEEELMILDPDSYALVNAIDDLLEDSPDGDIKPELMESVLEISTKPCADLREAGVALRSLRRQVRDTADKKGFVIGSAGTHPLARWEDQRITAAPRYRDLVQELRFVARQEIIFGLHVHVGLDDPNKAIHVANGMRVHVPILLALSANSPYWRGDDTGLASTRMPIFRAFPRVGIPPYYKDWDDYAERIGFMVDAGVMEDYTWLWYDVRPHPNFGTVEIRAMDAQTHVEHTLGAGGAHPGHGQGARRALRRRQAARRLSVRDARREQVARVAARAGGRARRPADAGHGVREGARHSGCWTGCASTRRTSAPTPSWTGSRTCSSTATGRSASARCTRRTATSVSCCRTSSRPRGPSHELASSRTRGRRRLGCPS